LAPITTRSSAYFIIFITVDEHALEAVFESFSARETEDESDDAAHMVYQVHAFPRPGTVAPDVP